MSKYLSSLLEAQEPAFSLLIDQLESAAAGAGVDVRLASEIRLGVKEKIKALGLDPKDTTAAELYHGLNLRAIQDDQALRMTLGITAKDGSFVIVQKLIRYFSKSPLTPEVWSLKRTALKKLLAENIPQRTMKALHYRSAASLLKRESPACVYAVATLIEGAKYKQKLLASIKHLNSSDFELSRVEFIHFSLEQWRDIEKYLKQRTVPVFSLPEANTVVVIPAASASTDTLTLLMSALLLHETRRLKENASYLKFRSLDSNLHTHVQNLAVDGRISMLSVQGQPVYWHHVHRVFSHNPDGRSYLEPHVNQDDLEWTALESSLASLEDSLVFWVGTHLLGFASGKHAVSMHLIDVCLNTLYKKPMEAAGRRFLQESLWDELVVRYLEVAPFSNMLERHMYKLTDNDEEILYD